MKSKNNKENYKNYQHQGSRVTFSKSKDSNIRVAIPWLVKG